MNPVLVSNETVPVHPTHLISILPAFARLLLIGREIDMRDIRSGHYRFFILLFGLQMKRGAGARRLSLMKERSQISSESYEWGEGGGGGVLWKFYCIQYRCTGRVKSIFFLLHWEKKIVCVQRTVFEGRMLNRKFQSLYEKTFLIFTHMLIENYICHWIGFLCSINKILSQSTFSSNLTSKASFLLY